MPILLQPPEEIADEIDEALSDAISNGEGRAYASYIYHALDQRGLTIVAKPVLSNEPPVEKVIADRVTALIKTADEWVAKVPKITDEATAAAARDFVAQLADEDDAVEAERMKRRKPLLDAAQAVQDLFNPMRKRLEIAKGKLLAILKTWQDAERARIQRERDAADELARKAAAVAAEAALAAQAPDASIDDVVAAASAAASAAHVAASAAAAAKAKPAIRGNLATRALAEHTVWTAEITNWPLVTGYFIDNVDLRAELQRLANAEARRLKAAFSIPGATVKKDTHL